MNNELTLLFLMGLAFILIGIGVLFLPNVKEKQPFTEEDIEEKEKKKKKAGLWWFTFKKYQTQVITGMLAILLILLTGNTILNTPVSSSQSSSSSNTSQTSSSSGTTSSSSNSSSSSSTSSSSVYEGNTIPTWDLTNPTISPVGSVQGLAYDMPIINRYQGDFYYQSGTNFLDLGEGVEPQRRLGQHGFSIYNVRTQEVVFSYTFTLSDTLKERMIADPQGATSTGVVYSMAYDQQDTIFVLLDMRPNVIYNDNTTTADGSFSPLIMYLQEKDANTDFSLFQRFLLSFNIKNPNIYTIIDGQQGDTGAKGITYSDILIDTNTLYISTNTNIESLVTTPTEPRFLSDLLPFPTHDNQLTLEADFVAGKKYTVSFLHRLTLNNTAELTYVDSQLVSFNTGSYINFNSYQEGLAHRFFNDEGDILLQSITSLTQQGGIQLSNPLNDIDSSFLGESQVDIFAQANPLLENLAMYVNDLYGSYPSMAVGAIFEGFYNIDSNIMSDVMISGYVDRVDGNQEMFYNVKNNKYRFIDEEGNTFFIQNTTFESRSWGGSGTPTIDFIHAESSLLKVDAVTLETTTVLSYSNNGPMLSGIYASETGYYLTGNLYPTEATPTVENIDAFLYQLDSDFNITDELVLSGSGFDTTSSIGFNAQGQPSWFVMSNSIDGDFSDFATTNPDQAFVHYSITF